jgi:hypothetical protein
MKVDRVPVEVAASVTAGRYHVVPSDHAHGAEEERLPKKTVAAQNYSAEVLAQMHAVQPKPTVWAAVELTWVVVVGAKTMLVAVAAVVDAAAVAGVDGLG